MDIAKAIRTIASQQMNASAMSDIVFGKVVSASPLAVQIDQKLTVDSDHLMLTGSVEERTIPATLSGSSSGSISIEGSEYRPYRCNITDTGNITLRRGLAVGEKVIMLRQGGGQMYVILDRVVSAS